MNVLITRKIPKAGLQLLKEASITYTEWTEPRELTPNELIGYASKHDALLVAGRAEINKTFLQACSHLKVITLMSVGYDNVDFTAANDANILIANTPDVLSGATADTAFLLLLATSRKAFYHHKRIERGNWSFFEPTADLGIELGGKTLGIFGLGSIGYQMAKRCQGAYDMKVIYHNRHPNPEAEAAFGAHLVSFEELLEQSDVISVHANLSSETKDIFNKAAFSKMRQNAIFINTARGGVHNETDLIEAINNKIIWGAGLDVTNPEPMQPDNPLLNMPNVCVLPHIGSSTQETRDAMACLAAKNIIAALTGKPLPTPVEVA